MPSLRALAPDGSQVAGFAFDGRASPGRARAGRRGDPRRARAARGPTTRSGSFPAFFYGENRPESCTRIYPRFTPGALDVERMESDSWSFRADRCATPAVFTAAAGS